MKFKQSLIPAACAASFLASAGASEQEEQKSSPQKTLEIRVDSLAQIISRTAHHAIRETQIAKPGAASAAILHWVATTKDKTILSGNFSGQLGELTRASPTISHSRLQDSLSGCFDIAGSHLSVPEKTRHIEACADLLRALSSRGILDGVTTAQLDAFDAEAYAVKGDWRLNQLSMR